MERRNKKAGPRVMMAPLWLVGWRSVPQFFGEPSGSGGGLSIFQDVMREGATQHEVATALGLSHTVRVLLYY